MPPERVRIKGIGGLCPVQGEGWVAGEEFYFRARWAGWRIEFGDQGEPPLWTYAEGYREDLEYAAGYMPVEEAEAFVRREAARFIAEVIGPEVSEREQEMWRFLPNVAYGPFEAVDLSMIRTGCASYNLQLEGRWYNAYVERRPGSDGLLVETWNVSGLEMRRELWERIERELAASAARLGWSVRTEVIHENRNKPVDPYSIRARNALAGPG